MTAAQISGAVVAFPVSGVRLAALFEFRHVTLTHRKMVV
jgi:hypothetical protein